MGSKPIGVLRPRNTTPVQLDYQGGLQGEEDGVYDLGKRLISQYEL